MEDGTVIRFIAALCCMILANVSETPISKVALVAAAVLWLVASVLHEFAA